VLVGVDVIKISVDGPAHVHDAGRGANSFERSMEGARFRRKSTPLCQVWTRF